jgi:hypothetical protein
MQSIFWNSYSFVIPGWTFVLVQSHIGVLETTPDNQAVLLMGLDYLISISYTDDTEVFKVCGIALGLWILSIMIFGRICAILTTDFLKGGDSIVDC